MYWVLHSCRGSAVAVPLLQLHCLTPRICCCCLRAGVTKLTDANDAGTRNSHLCTLILTEGDSAKTLAMSGLSVVGHDHWGVFPLRWAACSIHCHILDVECLL